MSRLQVSLHGSLAFTAKGHGSDKAVILGLSGEVPESVDPDKADAFREAARRYLPGLAAAELLPDYAGIRPKLAGPGERQADFLVQSHATHGLPGLINLFGIESPGLTACLALAEHACGELGL